MSDYGIGGRNWRKFWLGSEAAQPGTSDFKAAYLYAEAVSYTHLEQEAALLAAGIAWNQQALSWANVTEL